MIDEKLLKSEEKAVFSLRSLYKQYGYLPYKMSKFEEYELYIRNKDFLVSDRVITFNDTNGRLLALKPDVTLSIIKNGEDISGHKQKVYYNENVYRVSERTHNFKEIMQTGIECIGDIDMYDIFEVVFLAAKSLSLISDDFILEISHLSLLYAVLKKINGDKNFIERAARFISEKNSHDLLRLCCEYAVSDGDYGKLNTFISVYGKREYVLGELRKKLSDKFDNELGLLQMLSDMFAETDFSDKIIFDFSVVNDMNYYNGIVFKGSVDGISGGIVSGGQYDNLMKRMNRKSGAIGFAFYLDLLERLDSSGTDFDADVLLLYSDDTDKKKVADTVRKIISSGRSVSAQKDIPAKLRFKETVDIRTEEKQC